MLETLAESERIKQLVIHDRDDFLRQETFVNRNAFHSASFNHSAASYGGNLGGRGTFPALSAGSMMAGMREQALAGEGASRRPPRRGGGRR
jgi:hypothetical protein